MLSTIANIILLVALGAAAFFMLQKMRGHKKSTHTPPADPASQEVYDKGNSPPEEEEINLTMKEKIELSWQFLTNITEQIMNRFSASDQERVQQAGQKLTKNGTQYQHDVHQEAHFTQEAIKTRVMKQNKSKNKGQSR